MTGIIRSKSVILIIGMHIDPKYYEKYSKETIDKAIEFLTYKHVDPMYKNEVPGKPTLYVFRHGQTTDNEQMIFSGWRDVELTEAGVKQALALAPKLATKKIDMLVASDLHRSIHTMQLAISENASAKNLEIIKEPRIKERHYGDYQGKSKLELYLENPEALSDFRRSYAGTPPNGESIKDVVARVTDFIEEIIPKMKDFNINVAVACHGNSIRGFRQYFEHLSDEETATLESPLGQDYLAYSI